MDLSDSAGVGAGVFQAVIADQGYGWIQTAGVATLTTALTAGADGNALTPVGSTDGTVDVSALVTDHICAIAIDASAKIVMLTCPR
jgi:type 1 fimbria pilin